MIYIVAIIGAFAAVGIILFIAMLIAAALGIGADSTDYPSE